MPSPRIHLTATLTAWLREKSLPVQIEPETGDAALDPPYAVVRVSSEEPLAPGQCEISRVQVVVAVFSAEGTSAMEATGDAEAVFDALGNPERADLFTWCAARDLILSSWLPMETETEQQEGRWMHAQRFECLAEYSPPMDAVAAPH